MDKKVIIAIVVGVVTVFCLCTIISIGAFIYLSDKYLAADADIARSTISEPIQDPDACDDTTSDYFSFHGVEEVVVSKNPCETMWLLAQMEEEYTLTAPNGQTLYVTVWRDYENNVTAGNTFTIRALDVLDADKDNATISIIRWVGSSADLEKGKAEVKQAVSEL